MSDICADRCQYAVDVAMLEHSCANGCEYEKAAARNLEQANYLATVSNRIKPAGVIPRVRRIAGRRHAKKPNWVLAMDIFCVGSNYAWGICRDAGLDPEATS